MTATVLPATVVEDTRRPIADGHVAVLAIGTANCIIPQDEYADWYFRVTKSYHLTMLEAKMKRISPVPRAWPEERLFIVPLTRPDLLPRPSSPPPSSSAPSRGAVVRSRPSLPGNEPLTRNAGRFAPGNRNGTTGRTKNTGGFHPGGRRDGFQRP
ncbi:hypothetical protein ACP4OV_008976 [Aristida adscensionis]